MRLLAIARNPTDLLEGGGDLVLDVFHEGADRSQAEIPGPGRVRTVPLPMCQEVPGHGRIEILKGQLRRGAFRGGC